MQPRSERFDSSVVNGGVVVTRVDSLRGGVLRVANIPVIGGAVTVDRTAAVRRTLNVSIADEDGTLTPVDPLDPLSAYGNELRVKTGFVYPDGSEELLNMGIFRIETSAPDNEGLIQIQGFDRSYVIARARFEAPFVIANNTNTVDAIRQIIDSRYPGLTISAVATARTTPLTIYEEGSATADPWTGVQNISGADGLDTFFDVDGSVIIRFEPDPTADPVVWEHLGDLDSIVQKIANKQDTKETYNIAVAAGEGTDNVIPVRAVVEVTDPTSPVYPPIFGRRPVFLITPFIKSFEQATAAATALLQRKSVGSEEVTFSAVPHPAHDAGDVVRVVNVKLGLDRLVVLKSFSIDLAMQQATTYSTYGARSVSA